MKPQLTISLLVSDGRNTLKQCLDSIVPLLEHLNSELIIVFTGKDSHTLDLIRQYTDHIIPFEWCDDFSKARNAGLKEAQGEWFLYLDDDEWFESVDEIIAFFQSGEYQQYGSANYLQRNYADWEGKSYSDVSVGRMTRLTDATHFELPIHEYLSPFLGPSKYFSVFVHHYGYIRENKFKIPRFDRNVPLLLKALEEQTDSGRHCMQLAQEYKNANEFHTAIEYCRKGLTYATQRDRIYTDELWMKLYLPTFLALTGQHELAIEEAENIRSSARMVDLGRGYLDIVLVSSCCKVKNYRKGLEYVRHFHQMLEYFEMHPDQALRESVNEIGLSSLQQDAYQVYVNGIICALEENKIKILHQIIRWIPWDREDSSVYYSYIDGIKEKYHGQLPDILEGFSKVRIPEPYVDFQKVLWTEHGNRMEEVGTYWNRCLSNCPDYLLIQLIETGVRCSLPLFSLLDSFSREKWNACCAQLARRLPLSKLWGFFEKISPELDGYPFFQTELKQHFLMKQMSQGMLPHEKMIAYLTEYCDSVVNDAKTLYQEKYFSPENYGFLPEQCQFALLASDILREIQCGDIGSSIPLLKELLCLFPQRSAVICHITKYVEEQLAAPPTNVPEEFRMLGEQVKQQIQDFMEHEQWQEAYELVVRLTKIIPGDLSVLKLKQNIITHRKAEESLPDIMD